MYMYIVHIQVLVYCKKCSYPLDFGPTQNLSNLFYTAKNRKKRWQLLQIKMYTMQTLIGILAAFAFYQLDL